MSQRGIVTLPDKRLTFVITCDLAYDGTTQWNIKVTALDMSEDKEIDPPDPAACVPLIQEFAEVFERRVAAMPTEVKHSLIQA